MSLVRSWPPSTEFNETVNEEHEIYARYQTTIHKDSPVKCNMNQFKRFLCESPLLPFSHMKGRLADPNLKQTIQDKDLDKEFVCELKSVGYGSFHQQYRLNGKLIGVGVIDILDKCVSSVYFFYDPDFQFLNLHYG